MILGDAANFQKLSIEMLNTLRFFSMRRHSIRWDYEKFSDDGRKLRRRIDRVIPSKQRQERITQKPLNTPPAVPGPIPRRGCVQSCSLVSPTRIDFYSYTVIVNPSASRLP